MKRILARLSLITAALCTTACVTSRQVFDSNADINRKPEYEDYLDRYLFALAGSNQEVDAATVCMERKPQTALKIYTFEDALLSVVTLGIYTPITARVWCN